MYVDMKALHDPRDEVIISTVKYLNNLHAGKVTEEIWEHHKGRWPAEITQDLTWEQMVERYNSIKSLRHMLLTSN